MKVSTIAIMLFASISAALPAATSTTPDIEDPWKSTDSSDVVHEEIKCCDWVRCGPECRRGEPLKPRSYWIEHRKE